MYFPLQQKFAYPENELNGALKNISDWLISNKLTPNVGKSNLLLFIQKAGLDTRLGMKNLK